MSAGRPLAGIGWMVVTGLLMVGVTAVVKHLGGSVPAAEAAFLRYLLGLVFLIPMLGPLRRARLDRRALRLFGLRGAAHTFGVILWFFAMTQIPMAEVTAMNYLTPVYITLGAALFLGERLHLPRMLAVGAALLGAAIILRPGFREVSLGHLSMLGTTVFFAGSYLIAKILADEQAPAVVVAMLSITVTIGLTPFAVAVWVWPSWVELGWLFVLACLATGGHLTMTWAFREAPLAVTQPVTFLQLIWSATLGWLLFSEAVDALVIAGGVLIVSAVSFIALRESRLKRPAGPAAP